MKSNRFILLTTIVICSSLLILLRRGAADESAAVNDSPFKSDFLVVSSNKNGTNGGGYIKGPHIRRIGNRDFIVGSVIRANDRWAALEGKTVWFAVEDVTSIYEYDSADEIKAADAVMRELRREATKAQEDRKAN